MDTREELRQRTKKAALRIVRLYRALLRQTEALVIGKQLLRSGTSVGAKYRAVCLSRSRAEFISRLAVVVEEANESVFWLELLVETGIVPAKRMAPLVEEFNELLRMFSAAWKSAKQN